ncbi:nickel/cobalt efflux transporter RcnA [Pseudomonas koreensis]|uniref:Nickel/cobalt efflux system n=2 Tax=Pseudomonas TaxID=286 RepID=A0A4Q4L548_9PSED|nr:MULTISPECIES: nickel/cobalt efflux transporter [Pseudomonas]MDM8191175.1 nickel/cobalt efflux transporter [Pseudomonas fluorescens]MDP8572420.1 nickel/cobalt efflux transporter [Pseudomonas iranensis]MDR7056508.1 nickel/cobalt exporter [Pseudomonas koreensis]RYM41279.1 nickel/cobalt efflux transporter RcnA [Pseudomonas koreensis]
MPDFAQLLQQGGANAWLYFPSAVLLGALHGLEPGHSKTMMAAFIVAIRGSVKQAVLLGLAATLSHTAVVWLVAIGGMYLGAGLDAQTTEPYFQLASAALIIAIALWMLWRTWRGERMFNVAHGHDHHDDHDHGHHHGHTESEGLALAVDGYQDAHERAHAEDIRKRFSHREVTTGQIVVFGLTGGLIPCPAAITVLLLCLQVKEVALGGMLVLCFSIGLAITLVTVGAAAAIGARQASNRWPWLGTLARRAPYVSGVLIIAVGLYVGFHGWLGLTA